MMYASLLTICGIGAIICGGRVLYSTVCRMCFRRKFGLKSLSDQIVVKRLWHDSSNQSGWQWKQDTVGFEEDGPRMSFCCRMQVGKWELTTDRLTDMEALADELQQKSVVFEYTGSMLLRDVGCLGGEGA